MKKKKLFKKGTAYLLSSAMVLTGVGSISDLGGVTVASAAGLTMPTPVLSLDFDGTTTNSTYEENNISYTLTDSEITADPDDASNKVFYNKSATDTGFMQSAQGTFANTSFSDGVSVHMKVRPNTQASDWNFLFGLGFNNAGWQVFDGTIGFIAREWTTDHFGDYFPGGNWQPGNTLGGSDEVNAYDYFMQADNCNKWYDLTYVYGTDGNFCIYVDGILTVKYTAKAGYDAVFGSIGENNNATFSLGGNVFTGTSTDETDLKRCDAYYDNVEVYNKTLTQEQVYYLATGEAVSTDKSALDAAIADVETLRTELYTTESAADFNEKLEAAKLVKNNASAEQTEIDAAVEALKAAKEALVLKSVDLTTGLVLDSDMTSATSVIDKTGKKVTAGGYVIEPLGTSSIGDGYIQSSESGVAQGAGIAVDKAVLDGASIDKGLTFNIKWKFSTAPASDWWDLFSIVDVNDAYLMRNTVGFVTWTEKGNVFPDADCKNGFAWNSCMSYETNVVKNLTVTIDNTSFRMYVDGVLACEKTDMTQYDFDKVFANMEKIYIGYAVNELDGDLQGQLNGLQVYHRALNAAEVDKLAATGTGVSFKLSNELVSVAEGAEQTIGINTGANPADTEIKSAVSADTEVATVKVDAGSMVITGVKAGETTVIANTSYGQSAVCKVTVTDEASIEDNTVYKVSISDAAKESVKSKNVKDVALSASEAKNKDVVSLVITPEEGYLIKSASVATEGSTCTIGKLEPGTNSTAVIKLSGFTADTIINSITVETEKADVTEKTETDKNVGGASLGGTDFTDKEVTNAITTAITNKESIDTILDESGNEVSDDKIDEAIKEIENAVSGDGSNSSAVTVSLVVNEEKNLDASMKETADKLLETDVKKQAEAAVAGTEIKDLKIAMPLDISFYATVSIKSDANDKNIKIKLKDTGNKKMTIMMTVPSSVVKEADDITRLFYVIHFHGEEQEIIPCKYDKTGNTITFESNKFSPFVLCYVDTAKKVSGGGLATYPITNTTTPAPTATAAPTATPTATVTPTTTPSGETTATPTSSPVSEPTAAPTATATPDGTGNAGNDKEPEDDSSLKVGDRVTVNNLKYEVTSTDDTKTVVFTGVKNSRAKVVIPATVKISGDTYKVKGITKNALKGDKKLEELTIGKNVKLIGANALNNCKNLKKIVIKTKKLTSEKVDKNAFKGVGANVTIKLPKGKVKSYKKLIKTKGADKKVKFK